MKQTRLFLVSIDYKLLIEYNYDKEGERINLVYAKDKEQAKQKVLDYIIENEADGCDVEVTACEIVETLNPQDAPLS